MERRAYISVLLALNIMTVVSMLSINHLLGRRNGRTTMGHSQLFGGGNIPTKLH